ncbi:hypothetical protein KSP39_PZI021091 [Platanthera zijinensis]|uniref:Ferredoxin-thioredoxin reductase catalytic chain, chloroplastic n=1 Tax=Platanthera zijinensis TaxID=2320716 RepID=A0AAP0FVG1_9ASPA
MSIQTSFAGVSLPRFAASPPQRRSLGSIRAKVEPSEKSVEIMRKFSEQYARRSQTYFCVDKGVTSVVIKELLFCFLVLMLISRMGSLNVIIITFLRSLNLFFVSFYSCSALSRSRPRYCVFDQQGFFIISYANVSLIRCHTSHLNCTFIQGSHRSTT